MRFRAKSSTQAVRSGSARRARAPRATALRPGLAPLELVLALPLLLMLMALMVDFAVTGAWKIRAAVVARDEAWSNRTGYSNQQGYIWPRNGATAWPVNWPNFGASRGYQNGNAVNALYNASIDQPVVRGPMLGTTQVNRGLFDPTSGLEIGYSNLQRIQPLLAAALPNVQFNLQYPLLDNPWQYQEMGLGSNQQRRVPVIYTFPSATAGLEQAYLSSVGQLVFSPIQSALITLDQDPEIYAFYGSYQNFYPQLQGFCNLNVQSIRENQVQRLIYRIQGRQKPHVAGVPETMARFFMQMYQQEMAMPGANAPMLQGNIQTLQQFISSL